MVSDPDNSSFLKKLWQWPGQLLRGLFSGLLIFGEWFERALQASGKRIGVIFDVLTRADSVTGSFLRLLATPFAWLGRGIGRFLGLIDANPLLRRLTLPIRWLVYPLIAVSAFAVNFFRTRPRAVLVWSIPFVLLLTAIGFFIWQVNAVQRDQIVQTYREGIARALASGKIPLAQLYQQKLQQLGSATDQLALQTIERLWDEGKRVEALEMAERMAPLEKPGFPAAHYWAAQRYLDNQTQYAEAEAVSRAAIHLEHLQTSLNSISGNFGGTPPELTFMQAIVKLKQDQADLALPLLASISQNFWPAALLRFEINVQLARAVDATADAVQLSQWTTRDETLVQQVNEVFFPLWTQYLLKGNRTEDWRRAVRLWINRFPDSVEAKRVWTMIQLEQIAAYANRGGESDLLRGVSLLKETATRIGQEQRDLLAGWVTQEMEPINISNRVLALFRRAEQDADLPTVLAEILGTAAAMRGETESAYRLLTQAVQASPNYVVALNNLAFVISEFYPEKLAEALPYAQQAVALDGDNIEMLETLGMIYFKLQRWREAADTLQPVIAARPDSQPVHAALAESYRNLGQKRLADIHAARARSQ